jgi:hypothetical protein
MTLSDWFVKWNTPMAAIADFEKQFGLINIGKDESVHGHNESVIQNAIRLEASRRGILLFRNNVGALLDGRSVPVRFGLANESRQMNEHVKSGDLIGIKRTVVTAAMVGSVTGEFISVEVKPAGWKYTGRGREKAQLAWMNIILANGGRAMFATDEQCFNKW